MSRASAIHNTAPVLLATLLVIAAFGPSAVAQSGNNSKRRDLAGRWRLNRELSVSHKTAKGFTFS